MADSDLYWVPAWGSPSFGRAAAGPDICSQLQLCQQMGQVISLSLQSSKTQQTSLLLWVSLTWNSSGSSFPCGKKNPPEHFLAIWLFNLLEKNIWALWKSDSSCISSCFSARPNVTIKAEMVQQRGSYFWVVSCISSGGRPDTDISLAPNATVGLQAEKDSRSDVQRLSVHLPAAEYDGRSLTCMFTHPKFSHPEERITTLPTFCECFSWVGKVLVLQKWNRSKKKINKSLNVFVLSADLHKVETDNSNFQDAEYLELQEGETDVISLHITSNVPRYSVICTK